jgi:hypothetical protein
VDWIAVAQDKYKSLAGVNVEINLLFYKMWTVSWLAENFQLIKEDPVQRSYWVIQ